MQALNLPLEAIPHALIMFPRRLGSLTKCEASVRSFEPIKVKREMLYSRCTCNSTATINLCVVLIQLETRKAAQCRNAVRELISALQRPSSCEGKTLFSLSIVELSRRRWALNCIIISLRWRFR